MPNKEVRKKKPKYSVTEAHDAHKSIRSKNLKYQHSMKEITLMSEGDPENIGNR